ncbi:TPA: hypothetical protein ACFI4H_001793, partial [Neisseria gonorrhoeae]
TVIPDNTVILKPVRQHRNLETRHSRAGGNLDLSVQELIGQNGFLRFSVLDSHFRGNDNS